MSDKEFSPVIDISRRLRVPDVKTWAFHFLWFFVTFVTTTLTGTVPIFSLEHFFPRFPDPQTISEGIWLALSIPVFYAQAVANLGILLVREPHLLLDGLTYSVALLFILTCHEFGHYIACRIYKVDSTLPYFIPAPHLIGVGTFGAFIKIRSPLPSRKSVFDIGVAGPLAGFFALIPIAIWGVYSVQPYTGDGQPAFILNDPLFLQLIAWFMNVDLARSVSNPYYTAAWIGLLVTSLNLIPAGQLDGGHAVYAVFGKFLHSVVAKVAFVVMAALAVMGLILYNSPSGLLFVVILAIMLRVGHPEPYDDRPLDKKRLLIAAFTLLVFILSFLPFPIQINLF